MSCVKLTRLIVKEYGGAPPAAVNCCAYATPAVANLIREAKTFQIYSVIQTSRGAGMMTLNDSLLDLVRKKVVDPREACFHAVNKTEFSAMLAKEGFPVSAPEK